MKKIPKVDPNTKYPPFDKSITIEVAEKFISYCSSGINLHDYLIVDFSAVKVIEPNAGAMIANALRRYSDNKKSKVILPNIKKNKSAITANVLKSNLLQSLAYHSDQIFNKYNENILEEISVLIKDYSNVENKKRKEHISITDIHSENTYLYDSYELFNEFFTSKINKITGGKKAASIGSMEAVYRVTYEATQNIVDHANKAPFDSNNKLYSYLTLNYHNKLIAKEDRLKKYIQFVSERLNSEPEKISFLELTISDDGAGIAARHSQNSKIYWSTHNKERKYIEDALSAGGTIKFKAHDGNIRHDPGFGFSKISQQLVNLHAYGSLRTGRSLYVLNTSSKTTNDEFRYAGDAAGSHNGYITGTILNILIPLANIQLKLGF